VNSLNKAEGAIAPSAQENIAMHVNDDLREGESNANH